MKRFTDAFRESTTLKLVMVPWALLVIKYAISDLMILGAQTTYIDPTTFAGAIALVLAPWLGREWKEAHYKGKDK